MSDKQSEMLRTLTILLLAVGLAGCTRIVIAPPAKGGWQALEGRPECRIWNPNRASQGTASWDGPCVKDRAQGEGTLVWRYPAGQRRLEQVYTGTMRRGRRHGHGIYSWPNGDRYEGGFVEGERQGNGVFVFASGDRYEGDFENGKGVLVFANGDRYEGNFENGKRHGTGVLVFANGDRYEGDFEDGRREGVGTYLYANGNKYEGSFRNGRRHGKGVFTFASGDRYEGTFRGDVAE